MTFGGSLRDKKAQQYAGYLPMPIEEKKLALMN